MRRCGETVRVLVSFRPRFQASISMRLRSSRAIVMSVKNRSSIVRLAIDNSRTRWVISEAE